MPTNEQRRKAAKRKLERQIERRQERARKRRQTVTIASVVGVVVIIAAVVGTYFALSGPGRAATPPQAAGACSYAPTPDEPASKPATPPDANPPRTGTVALNLATSQGAIPLTLDRTSAPCAVGAVASLAQQGFYDDTPCHRLTTGDGLKVLQCGDPSGSGSGGAGFTYGQEPPPQGVGYTRGTVAMANTGQPNSTGSQFFLVYGDSQLPPDYSVVGKIADPGLAVLDKVAAAGDDGSNGQPGDGKPKLPVTIQRATLGAPSP